MERRAGRICGTVAPTSWTRGSQRRMTRSWCEATYSVQREDKMPNTTMSTLRRNRDRMGSMLKRWVAAEMWLRGRRRLHQDPKGEDPELGCKRLFRAQAVT